MRCDRKYNWMQRASFSNRADKHMKEKLLHYLRIGLKCALAIIVLIFALVLGHFIITNVATYFFPPLLPLFDPERLGQLGDFLGGTLNPIFGCLSVALILWSISIQRKELKETVAALQHQNNLTISEQTRSE